MLQYKYSEFANFIFRLPSPHPIPQIPTPIALQFIPNLPKNPSKKTTQNPPPKIHQQPPQKNKEKPPQWNFG